MLRRGVRRRDLQRRRSARSRDKVLAEMADWQGRPLDAIYPVIFIDAMVVKIRDGMVANRPVYCAIGVTLQGERDILGLWVGTGGEGSKFWQQVLTEIKNRGTKDVCIVVSDGLTGHDARRSPRRGSMPSTRHASSTCCGTRSGTPPAGTGRDLRGPATGVPRLDRARRTRQVRRVHATCGARHTPPSSSSGNQRGRQFLPNLEVRPSRSGP
jgi:hypothetical protein